MSIIDTLITDRTGGAYEASDMSRVEEAVQYLDGLLRSRGYMAGVQLRPEPWRITGEPPTGELERYLGNVYALVDSLSHPPGSPELPESMNGIDHIDANNIEKALQDLYALYQNMTRSLDLGWALGMAHIGLYGGT